MGSNSLLTPLCQSCEDKDVSHKVVFVDGQAFYVCRFCLPVMGNADVSRIEQLVFLRSM